jgi:ABC-type dipeptide/oligopeptide/nickel transport system permease component
MLYSVAVLIAASFLVFFFVTVSGDPIAGLRVTPNVSQEYIEQISERKNLNDPIPLRYLYWVEDAATDQFGTTLLSNRPILPDLWRVMKNTLQLVLIAQTLAILLGVGIGLLSALRQYSVFDYGATSLSFLGLATPVFWLGLMAQVLIVLAGYAYGVATYYYPFPFTENQLRMLFGFSRRQAQVARLLALRWSNKEIARELAVTGHTARRHTEFVLRKLRINCRRDVREALLRRLSDPGSERDFRRSA